MRKYKISLIFSEESSERNDVVLQLLNESLINPPPPSPTPRELPKCLNFWIDLHYYFSYYFSYIISSIKTTEYAL